MTHAAPILSHDDPLARACLAQFAEELSALDDHRAALHSVHAALLGHDPAAFEQAVACQDESARRAADVQAKRQMLLARLAERLATAPDHVTLTDLAAACDPELRRRVTDWQERLRGAATEVVAMQRHSALVMQRASDLFDHLLSHLTGEPDSTECYTASGRLESHGCGTVVQTEC